MRNQKLYVKLDNFQRSFPVSEKSPITISHYQIEVLIRYLLVYSMSSCRLCCILGEII